MKKLILIMGELFRLVRQNKLYFLAPIFLGLGILAFLVYTLGPAVVVSFLYAGI